MVDDSALEFPFKTLGKRLARMVAGEIAGNAVIASAMVLGRAIILVSEGELYAIKRYGQGLEGGVAYREDQLAKAWRRFLNVQTEAVNRQASHFTGQK